MCPLQGRWRLFTNLDFYGILNTLPFRGSAAATNITKKNLTIASSLRNRQILFYIAMMYRLMAIGFHFTAIGYCKQSIELKSL